ncbi:hypothetical protein Goarm_008463 [Gossypium armourianum]|uniref:Uncharacterized protein n=1 Tax=Gossypium armourianum TaxID=34283 RepID=A0A7J9JPZ5_9ROSI|nr:hypothetical protein [Gossypium armourianum]
MMIPMWGLISGEEVALHLYEETASPHALFGAKSKLIPLTNAHPQSYPQRKLN